MSIARFVAPLQRELGFDALFAVVTGLTDSIVGPGATDHANFRESKKTLFWRIVASFL